MRLRRRAVIPLVALAAGVFAGCGGGVTERDQWTVWVTTDAPVPQLADRALVEILDESGVLACADCQRQLGIPTDPAAWPFSFGIATPDGAAGLRVRVRLYRASRAGSDGLPVDTTTIDLVGELPRAAGNTDVPMVLRAECLGVASDVAGRRTCAGPERALVPEEPLTVSRPDAAIRPGTWPRAASVPCSETLADATVCVPGGFFVLGDAHALTTRNSTASSVDERYVSLSPFAMDRDEVTVGAIRALLKAGRTSQAPTARSQATPTLAACTFLGVDDPANDELAVNCITADAAAEACHAMGKRLPTEAEWEWAAGNTAEETKYTWGDVGDPCDFADVGLGRDVLSSDQPESTGCRVPIDQPTRPAGLPAHGNERDVTRLGVRALAGGVSEWVADSLASYRASCWHPDQPFLQDPRCDDVAAPSQAVRGSAWTDTPALVAVVGRQGLGPHHALPSIGFRCARSDGATP